MLLRRTKIKGRQDRALRHGRASPRLSGSARPVV